MQKVKAWLAAARLRTLPLSVSGIIIGAALGFEHYCTESLTKLSVESAYCTVEFYNTPLFWLAILVTIGFQVLSNFANDYGDGIRGTDAHREGEQRMVASGIISPKQMKYGMIAVGAITFLLATILIFIAFGGDSMIISFVFFNLTLLALIAAIKYTVGKKAYGYSGFGDVFVFLFFGLLAVLGTYFLYTKSLGIWEFLPAISVGFFSMAVLNLNNMRDMENDAKAGKRTLVVKLGLQKAKLYHLVLLFGGMLASVAYTSQHYTHVKNYAFVIAFIPLFINLIFVLKNQVPAKFDGELKKVALSTFLFAVLFALF